MSARTILALIFVAALATGASAASKKARKARASSSEGPDLDAAARRELQCPKGFVAEKADGPHLVLTDDISKKAAKGRRKRKADRGGANAKTKTRTLSRRCVPAASLAKPAADDGAKARRTAAEALRD